MPEPLDLAAMEAEIGAAYAARTAIHPPGTHLGWRLLYSPPDVVGSATVAFVGIKPGGRSNNPDHGEFAMDRGSAFDPSIENWGRSSNLQRQVQAIFRRLGVRPDSVLAGNVVPFRAPCWQGLHDKEGALIFGEGIWRRLIAASQPKLVISMGEDAHKIICSILGVRDRQLHHLNPDQIGRRAINAWRSEFEGGVWIGLPHLSRLSVMTHETSKPTLDALFADLPDLRP